VKIIIIIIIIRPAMFRKLFKEKLWKLDSVHDQTFKQ